MAHELIAIEPELVEFIPLPTAVTKLIRGDQVAVLYSPGFGAGWTTWNSDDREVLCFDHEIAQAVLDGDKARAAQIAAHKCPGAYLGGADQLRVAWVPRGTLFEIEEYDGSETLHVIGQRDYLPA